MFVSLLSPELLALMGAACALLVLAILLFVLLHRTKDQLRGVQQQLELAQLDTQHKRERGEQLALDLSAAQTELAQRQQHAAKQQALLAATKAQSVEAAKNHQQQLQLLDDARKQLKLEFENLANRIFEEKKNSFVRVNKQGLDQTLSPLREQLSDFKRKVEDVYDKESKERVSLLHEITHLKNLNQQISQDAVNLTRALKSDNKAQGNWGEVILERVLEESGLRKGHEYVTQASLKDEHGKRFQPDVVVHLPDNKDVVIDSKMSLVDYERYCTAEADLEKETYLKAHINSVKQHLKGISAKNYEDLEGIKTLDFILVFIPIEPAFLLAFEHDGDLFRDAYDKGVIIVSPTTLLAVLRTVQSLWRYERQNLNAEEIARIAGQLHDKIASVAESVLLVGDHLDKARSAQQTSLKRLCEGKGNLVSTAERLATLGAKNKKTMPDPVKTDLQHTLDDQ